MRELVHASGLWRTIIQRGGSSSLVDLPQRTSTNDGVAVYARKSDRMIAPWRSFATDSATLM